MFEPASIVGLGLMGTSLGLALRERARVHDVVAYDAAVAVKERAYVRGAVTSRRYTAAGAIGVTKVVPPELLHASQHRAADFEVEGTRHG